MIEFHLSGGTGNTNPQLSIGGAIATQQVQSETVSFHAGSTIGGVAVVGGVGNLPDTTGSDSSAALFFKVSEAIPQLVFTPYGEDAGSTDTQLNNVAVMTGSGNYVMTWWDSWGATSLKVTINAGSLPVVDTLARLDVSRNAHQLFDTIPQAENITPVNNYRCVYAKNVGVSSQDLRLFLSSYPLGASVALGLDPSGVGGTPGTLANETTPPSGVTFSSPADYDSGVPVTLAAGAFVPIWLRRQPLPMRPKAIIGDNFNLIAGVVT
jgi:hypothetical protein